MEERKFLVISPDWAYELVLCLTSPVGRIHLSLVLIHCESYYVNHVWLCMFDFLLVLLGCHLISYWFPPWFLKWDLENITNSLFWSWRKFDKIVEIWDWDPIVNLYFKPYCIWQRSRVFFLILSRLSPWIRLIIK